MPKHSSNTIELFNRLHHEVYGSPPAHSAERIAAVIEQTERKGYSETEIQTALREARRHEFITRRDKGKFNIHYLLSEGVLRSMLAFAAERQRAAECHWDVPEHMRPPASWRLHRNEEHNDGREHGGTASI
jgi:hypothetical protein